MARPNVVFILADDMGYGDFGAFNEGRSQTPALDRLVSEGVTLSHNYTASPVCNPSRAAILTGRYPHRTGSIDTLDWRGLDRIALRERTIGDALRSGGYATGYVGKWHSGALDPRYHPNARGFDHYFGFQGGWQDYWRWNVDRNGSPVPCDGRYLTDVFTDEAVSFIEQRAASTDPFLLHVAYNAPHDPLHAPEEDVEPFRADGRFNEAVCRIYGMVRRMDAGVARILEALKKTGVADNTIVIFTSDNGPQFGGTGDNCHDRFNCGLHGSKGNTYEGGIKVPMIVRWPDGLPRGEDVHHMVHFTDILPTLLDACGVTVPDDRHLDGHSVLAALRGEEDQVEPLRFWQWNRYTPVIESNAAMRDGDWKLVRPAIAETMVIPRWDIQWNHMMRYNPEIQTRVLTSPEPARDVPPPPPVELYNISDDPNETRNLADEHPERVRAMIRELETWFESVEADRAAIDDVW